MTWKDQDYLGTENNDGTCLTTVGCVSQIVPSHGAERRRRSGSLSLSMIIFSQVQTLAIICLLLVGGHATDKQERDDDAVSQHTINVQHIADSEVAADNTMLSRRIRAVNVRNVQARADDLMLPAASQQISHIATHELVAAAGGGGLICS